MRPAISLLAVLWLICASLLAACNERPPDKPSQLDLQAQAAQRQTQTALAPRPTNTPWPTPWPTVTRVPRNTPRPSPTPCPTREPPLTPLPVIGTQVARGEWLSQPFTDERGQTRTLEEFLGRAVVLHTLSASCALCIEQQQRILQAAQDRYDLGLLTDTVFLALDVVPGESASFLLNALRSALGEQWATAELLLREDVPADYVVGTASNSLLAALKRSFGDAAIVPEAATVIVFEPDGTAHLLYEGLVDWHDLRDAITQYGNPPPDQEP